MGEEQEGNGKCVYVQLCIPISTYGFRVHIVQCMHTSAREVSRVGIDGPVNIQAVRLVD